MPSITGSYDISLVILSVLMAIVSSFVALGLAVHISSKKGSKTIIWIIGGATAMGGGIWSMHFIGMLAYSMQMPVRYHLDLTAYSLLIAILGSGAGLYLVARERKINSLTLMIGGFIMGLAIASMHYIGMDAMDMAAEIHYDPWLVAGSSVIAIAASTAALYIAFYLRESQQDALRWLRSVASVVMGLAVSGMHYMGMAAASFIPTSTIIHSVDGVDTTTLVAAITIIAILIQGFALIALVLDDQIKAEQRYHIISDNIIDGLITINNKVQIEEFNLAAQNIFGYAASEVIGQNVRMLMPDPYKHEHNDYLQNYISTGTPKVIGIGREVVGLRKDGRTFPMDLAVSEMLAGEQQVFVGLVRDISQRKMLEEKQHKSNLEISRATTRALSIFEDDVNHHYIFLEMLEHLLSITQSQYGLIGAVFHKDDGTPYLKTYATNNTSSSNSVALDDETCLNDEENESEGLGFCDMNTLCGEVISTEKMVLKNDLAEDKRSGSTPVNHLNLNAFLGIPLYISKKMVGMIGVANRPGGYDQSSVDMLEGMLQACASIIAAFHNNNLRLKAEKDVRQLAHFDSLTGLPNRPLFIDRLTQILFQARRDKSIFTLLFLDLDGFKAVNDTAGHKAGDDVLKLVAERLRARVRTVDTVARLGGDEFTLILPGTTNKEQAIIVANKVIATLGETMAIDGVEYHIGASIGITLYPIDGDDVEALLKNADAAMYAAKAAGKNRCVFYQDGLTAGD